MSERPYPDGIAWDEAWRQRRRADRLEVALKKIADGRGMIPDKSTIYMSGRVPEVCAKSRHYFRDVYDHLARIDASLDSVRETIGTAIQVNISLVTIDQTEVSKRLAAWAGIFAVATAFAGIWGMNFSHMPELEWEYGYFAGLGVIASASAFLWWRFRKARWL